ncbi:MAG: shikimate kinase [Pseudomonadota bacterium]
MSETHSVACSRDALADYVAAVGLRVRERRERFGYSRRVLAERSGVSQRYLAQLELGSGNASISVLRQIALALDCTVGVFVDEPVHDNDAWQLARAFREAEPGLQKSVLDQLYAASPAAARAQRIALIGLRGAGKSTLGAGLAARLGCDFVELDALITERSGLNTADVMAVYGQEGYREIERAALLDFIDTTDRAVVAVAGGVVTDSGTFAVLRARCQTVWLRADAHSHMERVRLQGDTRPMAGHPAAMNALVTLLRQREPLYAQAERTLDTERGSTADTLRDLVSLVELAGWSAPAAL